MHHRSDVSDVLRYAGHDIRHAAANAT
eukprot:COSAG02_NODE_13483_length_1389_cov_1.382171_1_plen_26_part_10